jgi:hypothetical protein
MADTWPVSGGSVGSRGSTETASPRSGGDPRTGEAMYAGTGSTVTGTRAADASPGQESLDAFGGEGATVIPGVGIDERPGANSESAMPGSAAEEEAAATPPEIRSRLTPSTDVLPTRTGIQDILSGDIAITLDSFLQSLQGSLSSILQSGLDGLLANLPAGISDLLNSTGLTGALSGMVDQLSAGLSDALGQMAGALQGAAQQLASGLGEAISSIPGIGPAFDSFTQGLSGFTENLQNAYNGLAPALQAGVDGLVTGVGANLVNKLNIPGLPNIDPELAGGAVAALRFASNPAVDLGILSDAARGLHEKIFGQTGETVFADVASTARKSANEMNKVVQQSSAGGFEFVKSVEEAQSNVNQTYAVDNGSVVTTPQTFKDTLNSVQLQSFETYQRIALNRLQDDRTPALYEELVTNKAPASPATRELYTNLSTNDRTFLDNLVTRFNNFYASERSGATLSQDTANRLG